MTDSLKRSDFSLVKRLPPTLSRPMRAKRNTAVGATRRPQRPDRTLRFPSDGIDPAEHDPAAVSKVRATRAGLRGRPQQAEGEPRQDRIDDAVDDGARRVGPRLPFPDRVAHVR